MAAKAESGTVAIATWLWKSYLKTSLIPLLFIELIFILIYWISTNISHERNVGKVEEVSGYYFLDLATREAAVIASLLNGVEKATRVYAAQTQRALAQPATLRPSELQRLERSPDGALYSRRDNGMAASHYSVKPHFGEYELSKISRLSQVDYLMKDIKESDPIISQIYFNSYDSYNRIYPYFDSHDQYPATMDVTKFNFYYQADARHNPERKAVWTSAYLDPAGKGWLVSSIAPVWSGDRLEGVVGIDITLDSIIKEVLNLDLPWDGYGMLVDRDGRIIALPPTGEAHLGLKRLKGHRDARTGNENIFKPERFNIARRSDTRALFRAISQSSSGRIQLDLNGKHLVAFATIPGPNWRLIVVVPRDAIHAEANALQRQLAAVGYGMIIVLILFYAAFFLFLFWRARHVSRAVATPIEELRSLMERIGAGQYEQAAPRSTVMELDSLGRDLTDMGHKLGAAHRAAKEQERTVANALTRERKAAEAQLRFLQVMSHEFRTPLAIIDSCAQTLDRRAHTVEPEEIETRAQRLRRAVQRLNDVLNKFAALLLVNDYDARPRRIRPIALEPVISGSIAQMENRYPLHVVKVEIPHDLELVAEAEALAGIVSALLDNAFRYSPPGTPIDISAGPVGNNILLRIANEAPNLKPQELAEMVEPFFRGSNAVTIPGSGIGLYLATTFAEKLGGRLEIDVDGNGRFVAVVHFASGHTSEIVDT